MDGRHSFLASNFLCFAKNVQLAQINRDDFSSFGNITV